MPHKTNKINTFYVNAHSEYIRSLYRSIEYSNNPFFIECMYRCVKDEEDVLNKYLNKTKN